MPTKTTTRIDLTGRVFRRWTVIAYSHSKQYGRSPVLYWLCRCECGTEKAIAGNSLRTGLSNSCGSCGTKGRRTHLMTGSPEYQSWAGMLQRVSNPKHKDYKSYGERGITVCERWHSFENFYADMGSKPSSKHSIERENNELGYGPDNCKWGSNHEQGRNKRTNRNITWNGRTQCITDWSREMGGAACGLSSRLSKGWTLERAMSTPFLTRTSSQATARQIQPASRTLAET